MSSKAKPAPTLPAAPPWQGVHHLALATSDLDGNERFRDLQLALAMFGASDREYDEEALASECKYALRLLAEGYED